MTASEKWWKSAAAVCLFAWIVVIVIAIFAAGCSWATAYGQCMRDKGLAVVGTVPQQVTDIMASPDPKDATVNALEGLATKAGTDAVWCALQALFTRQPRASTTAHAAMKHEAAKEWAGRHRLSLQ